MSEGSGTLTEIQIKKCDRICKEIHDMSLEIMLNGVKLIRKDLKHRALKTQDYLVLRINKDCIVYCKLNFSDVKDEYTTAKFKTIPFKDWLD